LAQAVAKAASATARNATRTQLVQWFVGGLAFGMVALVGTAWVAYYQGLKAQALGAKARGTWAESSEGLLAYELSQTGSIRVLAMCEGPGWEVRDGKCFPQPLHGQTVYGWRIPSPTHQSPAK
jgi:hypothetical protein